MPSPPLKVLVEGDTVVARFAVEGAGHLVEDDTVDALAAVEGAVVEGDAVVARARR